MGLGMQVMDSTGTKVLFDTLDADGGVVSICSKWSPPASRRLARLSWVSGFGSVTGASSSTAHHRIAPSPQWRGAMPAPFRSG